MNRIHEQYKRDVLLVPQSIGAGGNATGAYKKVLADHEMQFHVAVDALLQAETVKVEVFQADDASGTNAVEVTACETVYTAPTGGVAGARITVSLDAALLTKPYVTAKVSNTSASAVITYVDLIQEARYQGAGLDDSDELTVV